MSLRKKGEKIKVDVTPPNPNISDRSFHPHFPAFILSISVFQIVLYYTLTEADTLALVLGADPYRRHEIWRLFTVFLAHDGPLHLFSNVIYQLFFGVPLEREYGSRQMAIFYMTCALGGSLFVSILSPNVYGVGASDAFCGLYTAHLGTIIVNWNKKGGKRWGKLFLVLPLIILDVGLNVFLAFIISGTFTKFIHNLTSPLEINFDEMSHGSHLGGGLTGFLGSLFIFKRYQKQENAMDGGRIQKLAANTLVFLFGAAVVIHVAFPWHFLPAHWNFEYEKSFGRRSSF